MHGMVNITLSPETYDIELGRTAQPAAGQRTSAMPLIAAEVVSR
jgi:hypothetical protein